MRRSRFVTVGTVGAVLALALAGGAFGAEKAKAPAKGGGGKAVLWAADELKWIDPAGAPPGVKMAVLWGDPAKGPHGAMHRFPAGFSAPLHHHTAGHHVVVVSGTLLLTPEGEAEKKLGPGSYFSLTGKKQHVTKCDAGAECVLFVDCGGPWDVVLAEAKTEAKEEAKK